LGIPFDSYNEEAFYNDKMDRVVQLLEEQGQLSESEGALVVRLDEYDLPPCLIKKSDGATLYVTRDLAAALYRYETMHSRGLFMSSDMSSTFTFSKYFPC